MHVMQEVNKWICRVHKSKSSTWSNKQLCMFLRSKTKDLGWCMCANNSGHRVFNPNNKHSRRSSIDIVNVVTMHHESADFAIDPIHMARELGHSFGSKLDGEYKLKGGRSLMSPDCHLLPVPILPPYCSLVDQARKILVIWINQFSGYQIWQSIIHLWERKS